MIGVTEKTQVLTAAPSALVDDAVRDRLVHRLSSGIATRAEPLGRGSQVDVTLSLLRQAHDRPASLSAAPEPFAWKPAFSRRSLGLAVVRACAMGRFRSPAEAAAPVADEAVAEWRTTGWRTFHWEPWLAGLAPGARAVVLAEAVTWATSLWSSLDWSALVTAPQIGGPDDVWLCPLHRAVRLKGRCELRVPLASGPVVAGAPPPSSSRPVAPPLALVSVASGHPGVAWEEELGYLALVSALRSPASPVPARVGGLWPDTGVFRVVDIDDRVLAAAADRTLSTVAALVDALGRRPKAGSMASSTG